LNSATTGFGVMVYNLTMSGYKYRIAAAALAALFLVSLAWRGLKVAWS